MPIQRPALPDLTQRQQDIAREAPSVAVAREIRCGVFPATNTVTKTPIEHGICEDIVGFETEAGSDFVIVRGRRFLIERDQALLDYVIGRHPRIELGPTSAGFAFYAPDAAEVLYGKSEACVREKHGRRQTGQLARQIEDLRHIHLYYSNQPTWKPGLPGSAVVKEVLKLDHTPDGQLARDRLAPSLRHAGYDPDQFRHATVIEIPTAFLDRFRSHLSLRMTRDTIDRLLAIRNPGIRHLVRVMLTHIDYCPAPLQEVLTQIGAPAYGSGARKRLVAEIRAETELLATFGVRLTRSTEPGSREWIIGFQRPSSGEIFAVTTKKR